MLLLLDGLIYLAKSGLHNTDLNKVKKIAT